MDPLYYLSNLPDQIQVAFNVSAVDGKSIKSTGTLTVLDPPELEIEFSADTLPESGSIDLKSDCLVFLEFGEIVTLICDIVGNPARGRLRVEVRDLVRQSEKREYFRVSADRLKVFYKRKAKAGRNEAEMSPARCVNISCAGMLVVMDKPVEKKERLAMKIFLPSPVDKCVACDCTVARVFKIKNTYFAGVKFDGLDTDVCDDIMSFCFAQQRRMLRENVITKDL